MEDLGKVDTSCYSGSYISTVNHTPDEGSMDTFTNLKHLWRPYDIRLSGKGRMWTAPMRSVQLYGSETVVSTTDVRKQLVFENRCFHIIGRVRWKNFVSDSEVRRHKVLGRGNQSINRNGKELCNEQKHQWSFPYLHPSWSPFSHNHFVVLDGRNHNSRLFQRNNE